MILHEGGCIPGKNREGAAEGLLMHCRMFFKCPKARDDPEKCSFFEWEDEPGAGAQQAFPPQQQDTAPAARNYSPAKAEGGAPCFKCGQVGCQGFMKQHRSFAS